AEAKPNPNILYPAEVSSSTYCVPPFGDAIQQPSRSVRLPMLKAKTTLSSMADDSIAELTAQIQAFCGARDWRQFHAPKELAVAIAAEAGELLQHFVWQTPAQSEQRALDRRAEIGSEIADVAILLFELADNLGLSLAEV